MEHLLSFAIGIATGWVSNFLWHKWQSRRKDTHITLETDSTGFKFSGRFNADATSNDEGSKDILNAINQTINKQ